MRSDVCVPTHARHWILDDLTEPHVLVRASVHDLDGPGGDGPGGDGPGGDGPGDGPDFFEYLAEADTSLTANQIAAFRKDGYVRETWNPSTYMYA